jgi:hypothetical protein
LDKRPIGWTAKYWKAMPNSHAKIRSRTYSA